MREPYQILSIPYRIINDEPLFCIFHRDDSCYWQFIAGGGENGEKPVEAAKRESVEEIGIEPNNIKKLTCIAYIPTEVIAESKREHWDKKRLLFLNIHLPLNVIQSRYYPVNIVNING